LSLIPNKVVVLCGWRGCYVSMRLVAGCCAGHGCGLFCVITTKGISATVVAGNLLRPVSAAFAANSLSSAPNRQYRVRLELRLRYPFHCIRCQRYFGRPGDHPRLVQEVYHPFQGLFGIHCWFLRILDSLRRGFPWFPNRILSNPYVVLCTLNMTHGSFVIVAGRSIILLCRFAFSALPVATI